MKIPIILGSVREGRQGEKVAKWVNKVAVSSNLPGVEFELLDLKDYPLPFYNEAMSPAYNSGNYQNQDGKNWAQKIGEGEAYIFVTPEYNHGTSGVLKNSLDWVYKEWNNKPALIVSYSGGVIGGARGVEQLRLILAELQVFPLREAIHLGKVGDLFDDTGEIKELSLNEILIKDLQKLVIFTQAFQGMREKLSQI